MDTKTLDKILKLNEKGLTLREIGTLVKLSPQGVKNTLDKYADIKKVAVPAEPAKTKKQN